MGVGASIRSQARTPVVEAVSLWETWRVFQGLWEGGDSRLSIDRQSHRLFQRDHHAAAIRSRSMRSRWLATRISLSYRASVVMSL